MHIIVPIKQVPQTSDVQMDKETGTMIRSGTTSILNPLDLYALETALRLKEQYQATITVLTMGPQSAVKVLKEAVAMGCDHIVHLSDRSFGGSDTWATSYVLSMAVKKLGAFDLIITGERATDGDTAQVGPAMASWLGLPVVSYVARLVSFDAASLVVERLVEEGYQKVRCPLPALLTVVKEIAVPRLPTLRGKKRAMECVPTTWNAVDLSTDAACIGLKGSPTKVVKIEVPKVSRQCLTVRADSPKATQEAVARLVSYLEEKQLLARGGHEHA